METPKWLKEELAVLARQRMKGDITRDEAIASAIGLAETKDPDLLREIHEEWFGDRAERALNRIKNDAAERGRIAAATGMVQTTFDEMCSSFYPRDTFGATTLLEDLWAWHEVQCAQTASFAKTDERREADLLEMTTAVGGNRKATWEQGEYARRRLLGGLDEAADG